jgi:hypothetical protein
MPLSRTRRMRLVRLIRLVIDCQPILRRPVPGINYNASRFLESGAIVIGL